MEINLTLEATFSSTEKSDIFLFIKNDENSEVAFSGITLGEILKKSFEEITDEEERRMLKYKISSAMRKFLDEMEQGKYDERS